MFDLTNIPPKILGKIADQSWYCDNIGMSGSTILLYDKMVLKIEKVRRSSEHEKMLLEWLAGKFPVPQIIEAEKQDDYSFLLMSRLSGEMACSDKNLRNIENTVKALAKGLKMLWDVNTSGCPYKNGLDEKLAQAKYRIENNLVDTDDMDEETLSADSFSDLWGLYDYLCQNRPDEDLVLSHGDYCLPNIFASDGDITGFLDWGSGGVADRWQDIALCVRSLKYNYMEYAGYGEVEYQFYKKLLFQEISLEPDEEKIRYYILLDELF